MKLETRSNLWCTSILMYTVGMSNVNTDPQYNTFPFVWLTNHKILHDSMTIKRFLWFLDWICSLLPTPPICLNCRGHQHWIWADSGSNRSRAPFGWSPVPGRRQQWGHKGKITDHAEQIADVSSWLRHAGHHLPEGRERRTALSFSLSLYIDYMTTYASYIYIYIYMYCIHIYMYCIHIYIYIYMYCIHIYIYTSNLAQTCLYAMVFSPDGSKLVLSLLPNHSNISLDIFGAEQTPWKLYCNWIGMN